MTATDTSTADQPDQEIERVPGEGDMWFFVLFESLVFTSYFCVYLYFRTQDEAAFLEAQAALTLPLGIVDTILLLTSSWAIARCAHHARAAQHRVAQQFAVATAGLGVAFLALKLVEWVALISDGHTFTSGDFMQHFFFLTGMHAIHLLIGFVVLGVLLQQLADPARRSPTTIETCTTYWHTVDLFWVLIFALLYIVR
ncbi:MAG: cytochrome c oxidase subunit 3 [Acidimicrobiales bacterium]